MTKTAQGQRTTPLSTADRDLLRMPSIASQMPVRMANGATWEALRGECKVCQRTIRDVRLTGRITQVVPTAITIDAVGVCDHCRIATRYHYRLHDDMRITGPTDQGWATWQAQPALGRRLIALAKNLLQG